MVAVVIVSERKVRAPDNVRVRGRTVPLSCGAMSDRGATLIQFGKYLLDGEIATGGMSKVFRARLRGPGGFEKRLVVKQILPQLAQDPNFIRMFVQEANTLVQMSHPNIVPVYELGVVDGVYFLAMELVEGATLSELLRFGPLPEALVLHMGIQICEALHYAHQRFSVIHRDVTPRNLVIDDAGHTRLLDFGIAAPADQAGRFGSVGYMSPEQARGLPLGPTSDLFAVGTLLFEALTCIPAYLKKSADETRAALLDQPAPQLPPQVASLEMRELVARCLATEVSDRPANAAEVAKALRAMLAKSHPGGVAPELGRRAHEARQQAANATPDRIVTSDETPSTAAIAGKSRTLATSPILDQLLQQTERIDRQSPQPRAPVTEPIAVAASAVVSEVKSATSALHAEAETPALQATQRKSAKPAKPTTRWPLGLSVVAIVVLGVWALRPLPPPPMESREPEPQKVVTSTPDITPTKLTTADFNVATKPIVAPPTADASTVIEQGTKVAVAPTMDAVESARAWLVINAVPWAEVKLDGRSLGSTPVRRSATEAGKHTLELSCPPLGRSARVPLSPKAGETVRVLVDLNQQPAKVTVQ